MAPSQAGKQLLMRKELLILHCRTGGGHTAAAEALAERARARGVPARTLDALSYAPSWFGRAYVDAHLGFSAHLPQVYGTAYFALDHRSAVDGEMRKHFDHWIGKTLLREVVERDPLAVVTTHFFPMGSLGQARREGKLTAPLIEVVTDYAAHAVWAEPGADAYCAPHGRSCEDLVRHGIPSSLVVDTGIPIRLAFAQAAPVAPLAPDAPLRILVTSGGFGVGPVTRVLRSLANVPLAAIDIICGKNPPLVARARRICERLGIDANVVGFEPNMPARVARAHVVVTKPGGLTISECLSAGRPLVLVGAVRGQETLNQAWLVEQGAAVACDPQWVGRAVAELRNGRLAQMAERARSLAAPYAADRVIDVALALTARAQRSDLSTLRSEAQQSGKTYNEALA
jgi:processive 1,2-diacylglycerol beta-glucosyltransferase